VHYHFTSHEAMEAEIAAGKFLEHAHVHKNIYGTSIQAVQDVANAGRCCVLDIDVQGARQVSCRLEGKGSATGCASAAVWPALGAQGLLHRFTAVHPPLLTCLLPVPNCRCARQG
jgi:hypothetical protein